VKRTRPREGIIKETRMVVRPPASADATYVPPPLQWAGNPSRRRRPGSVSGPALLSRRPPRPAHTDTHSGQRVVRQLPANIKGPAPKTTNRPATQGTDLKLAGIHQEHSSIYTISITKSPDLFRAPERDRPLVTFPADRPAAGKKQGKARRGHGKAGVRHHRHPVAPSFRTKKRRAK